MTGVLLVNVGTPAAPEPAAVRAYLREFLGDPRVLDINALGRWLLLHLHILRTRPARSAAAYRAIWTPEGSPLLVHGRALAARLGEALGAGWDVQLAMRYGQPSLAAAFAHFRARAIDRVVLFPLYPQYSASATGTTVAAAFRLAAAGWHVPSLAVVSPFYDHPAFVRALAAAGRPVVEALGPDHVLMSFHGLPERHLRKVDDSGRHCLAAAGCCDRIGDANRNCYRAQCFATARALAAELGLRAEETTVAFQSRLGRTPWIRPHTDQILPELARKGARRVAVFCPAFVADCLETLEEIGLRARDAFRAAGGAELVLVPSLNASPAWVEAAAALVRETAPFAAEGPRLLPSAAAK